MLKIVDATWRSTVTSVLRVCSFSVGIDEMPRRKQADDLAVLRVLAETQRFSIFEATANQTIARTMTRLMASPYLRDLGGAYPWTHVEVTEAGHAALGATP